MEIKQYQAAIEAIVFASGEPVPISRLALALELDEETTRKIAEDWAQDVNTRGGGMTALKLDDSYQLCSSKAYAGYVRKAMDIRRNTPLSQAAMEVLAIIAYNQPVTRPFVEQVRGVDCSAVIQGLQQKGLIEEKGRMDLPGRPLLYGTSANFLRCFGVSSLDQLPPLPQKEDHTMRETTLDEVLMEQQGIEPEFGPDETEMELNPINEQEE
ncbi:MAG: SMC-Scp complex subunit ScpB [Ruminococcaceae bacterium]|nr:SMC-Scp complex subunit ScpB [Oscillospiraceae bacterium]